MVPILLTFRLGLHLQLSPYLHTQIMENPIPTVQRKIIHVDMDAFFAAVEQRDNPDLRGKPVAVGGGGKRGVLTTASYEARKFGVRSAMPGFKAKAQCPDLIFVKPRFEAYKAVSKKIREIFSRYTDLIEPLSLDEAYLDVSECKLDYQYATDIAAAIKQDIVKETELTASAGVSYCKFIAKIASDIDKPDGLTVIKPKQAIAFLETLEIEKFYGVGKVTARKMKAKGIHTGLDLKGWSKLDLATHFGKSGRFYYDIVRGIDDRPVKAERIRKSLGVERTFEENKGNIDELKISLDKLIDTFLVRLEKNKSFGKTITLKMKTADFQILTRSQSQGFPIKDKSMIAEMAHQLLINNFEEGMLIRLMGLTSSNFVEESNDSQLSMF